MMLTFLMVTLFANAQSLLGTWYTHDSSIIGDDISGLSKFEMTFTFTSKGTATLGFNIEVQQEEEGMQCTVGIKCDCKGTYKKTGNSLSMNLTNKKAEITKLDVDLSPEMQQALTAMGMTKQALLDMIKKGIKPDDMAKEMAKEIDDISGALTISSLTSTSLVLKDETNGMTIKLKKK